MKKKMTVSTDDIFSDLDLADAEEMGIRSDLLSEVVTLIRSSGLSQKEIAVVLGVSAPKVSALMTGKINDFSKDTLMNYLMLIGCNVEIKVTLPKVRKFEKGSIKLRKASIRRRRTKSNV